jgi:hypothetical protein
MDILTVRVYGNKTNNLYGKRKNQMGTRIWYETKLLNDFNEIRFARMYYDKNKEVAVAYVADSNHQLSDDLKCRVESYLREEGSAALNHEVKPYSQQKQDGVPEVVDVPIEVRYVALFGELNQKGIVDSLNKVFPNLGLQLAELKQSVLKIWLPSDSNLSPLEIQLLRDYAQELVPINVSVEII